MEKKGDVGCERNSYTSHLLHLLDQQREAESHCDVTVVSNDAEVFHAHSAVLAASSPLFSSKLSEGNIGQVMLDVDGKSIQILLNALYAGISSVDPVTVMNIRFLAESFEMNDLVKLCDGAIVFGVPQNEKPVMIDQATNTEKIPRQKRPLEIEDDEDLDSGSELVVESAGDPDYRPGLRASSSCKVTRVRKRKRGRPPKSKHFEAKQLDTTVNLGQGSRGSLESLCSVEIMMTDTSNASVVRVAGPRTRSASGISKQKPELRKILTAPKVSTVKAVAKISSASNISNDSCDTIVKHSDNHINVVPMHLLDNLVIEGGDVDEVKVNDAFAEILNDIEHENAKAAAIDSKEFKDSVNKSFSEIMNLISEKNNIEPVTDLTNSDLSTNLMKAWKNCQYCSQFKGKKRGRFDFHLKYCSTDIKCSLCHKPFLTEDDLSRHTCSKVLQECVCEQCGKKLVGKNALTLHMKIHLDIRKHVCKYCGKRFIRKGHLTAHVRHIHSRERPYVCTNCTARFAMKTELTRHMQKHRGPPQYACAMCGKAFYVKSQAMSHFKVCQKRKFSASSVNTIHSRPTYMCSLCKNYFFNQEEIVLHSCHRKGEQNAISTSDQSQTVCAKQDNEACTVFCIVPEDSTTTRVEENHIATFEEMLPGQHAVTITKSAAEQVFTLEEVFQSVANAQDMGQEQVLHFQSIPTTGTHTSMTNVISFQHLQDIHDLQDLQVQHTQTCQVPIEEYSEENVHIANVQILQGVEYMTDISAEESVISLVPPAVPTTLPEQDTVIVPDQVYAPRSLSV